MSGLLAVLNLDGAPVDATWIQATTSFMSFRGPDAQQIWHDGCVGFGHTLLRTTFESAHEQQPCTLDGKVWLVADARIDDRPQLIAELRAGAHNIANEITKDIPDPLLILHAYHLWGEQCLDHLLGDFAFVLWNQTTRCLFCARMSKIGAITNLPTNLVAYRQSSTQLSTAHAKAQMGQVLLFLNALLLERFGWRVGLSTVTAFYLGVRGRRLSDEVGVQQATQLLGRLYRAFLDANSWNERERQFVTQECAWRYLLLAWTHRRHFRSASRVAFACSVELAPDLWTNPQTRAHLRQLRTSHQDLWPVNMPAKDSQCHNL